MCAKGSKWTRHLVGSVVHSGGGSSAGCGCGFFSCDCPVLGVTVLCSGSLAVAHVDRFLDQGCSICCLDRQDLYCTGQGPTGCWRKKSRDPRLSSIPADVHETVVRPGSRWSCVKVSPE